MLLALGAITIAFLALAAARLLETHIRVQQLFDETDRCSQETSDVVPEPQFSRDLLALSTVRSLAPDDFRAPAPGESSSSESAHHAQLKTPGQAP